MSDNQTSGVATEGFPDQYADGKAAKIWDFFTGSKQSRTGQYRNWILSILRKYNCKSVLDVACGTGMDSIMLLEEGYEVASTDGSDQMLKYALKERWNRRKEEAFDKWIIEEGNWLTLTDDLKNVKGIPEGGFDAVICLGNSFAHMPDSTGDFSKQKLALKNIMHFVKPGGVLLIDHRNFDIILDTGVVSSMSVYYTSQNVKKVDCSNLYVNGKPKLLTMDIFMEVPRSEKSSKSSCKESVDDLDKELVEFRCSFFPFRLEVFTKLLKEVFGEDIPHSVYGDFKPIGDIETPFYYIHILEKKLET